MCNLYSPHESYRLIPWVSPAYFPYHAFTLVYTLYYLVNTQCVYGRSPDLAAWRIFLALCLYPYPLVLSHAPSANKNKHGCREKQVSFQRDR